jgi:pyruvate formate lyase activating enzyme
MAETTLGELLDPLTTEGDLYEALPDGAVRCYACGHRCLIRPGRKGICKVRFNQDGRLQVPWGYVGALQSDPTEKKPFFHLLPGSDTLTFGMLGCDFHCSYCQNWVTSQAMRDPASDVAAGGVREISPADLVDLGVRAGAQVVGSSYNEPLITSEWALSVFKEAKQAGLLCAYISNGNATREVLEYLKPYVDGYKIDLKTMNDKSYRSLGGVLDNVLESIAMVKELGIWLEVVTLVVPGFNDSTEELMSAARFLRSISLDIPWHVTAFHKEYRMTDPDNTTGEMLIRAAEIGQEAGLRYVYAGNLPGQVGDYEHTICPSCHSKVIQRIGYVILEYDLTEDGNCSHCGAAIPGIWPDDPNQVRRGQVEDLYFRRPKPAH